MSKNPMVVTQPPNLPVIVATIASALGLLVSRVPVVGPLVLLIAFGAWFTWAWLEIFQGINIIRRLMGGAVMGVILTLAVIFY